ncbi:MAG: aquaporin Z [Gemmataceae bacterium]|nr:aquaporin Z [Gemmataceae bacterium]
MGKKLLAEGIGTFWLVFGGCGGAVLAATVFVTEGSSPINIGIGLVGVSLAFGLTVLTMAYAIGHISGCHLNPAVTAGLVVGGRFPTAQALPYIAAQVAGGLVGAGLLYMIATNKDGYVAPDVNKPGVFATNGYGAFSPGGYQLAACLAAEVVLTAMFLFVILGATDRLAPSGFAPIAIGLGLTLIHLIGIPVTNLSVNPARSTGPAVVVAATGGTGPLGQLWLFWAAPLLGGAVGGFLYGAVAGRPEPARA